MDTCNKSLTRRERRRRQNEEKLKSDVGKQWKFAEEKMSEKQKNFGTLVLSDAVTVSKAETAFHTWTSGDEEGDKSEEDFSDVAKGDLTFGSDSDGSKYLTHTLNGVTNSNTDSKNLTYSLCDDDDDDGSVLKHDTYSIQKIETDSARPIPAPRKCHPVLVKENDKLSFDGDRDTLKIEVDEIRYSEKNSGETLTKESSSENPSKLNVPKPKPRKLSSGTIFRSSSAEPGSVSKSKSLEQLKIGKLSPRSVKSNPETRHRCSARSEIQEEAEGEESPVLQTKEKKRGRIFDFLLQKKKSSKKLSSVMKLEKTRIPAISSILKDLRDEGSKSKLGEDYRKDFYLDSPYLPQTQQNDKMYVQRKNGFYLKSREDVLKGNEGFMSKGEGGGMENSTTSKMLRTATMFQKYWSRSMVYFHGVLAGFGFCHAFTISAIMFYFNYEFQGFVNIYTFLALKIHFIFYTLIALCIISCLDRLDVGHMKMKHWAYVCVKYPSLWLILFMYLVSFILTFVNHSMEFKFDNRQYENLTGEMPWDSEVYDSIPEDFSSWYRLVWIRDMIVLAAWSLISLTEFEDNLYLYVVRLSKNLEGSKENSNRITLTVNS